MNDSSYTDQQATSDGKGTGCLVAMEMGDGVQKLVREENTELFAGLSNYINKIILHVHRLILKDFLAARSLILNSISIPNLPPDKVKAAS